MKLKSRGLGRKELTMDFREYTVRREGDEIVIVGTIREPVHWDFTIRMCEDDLAGVTRVALQRPTLALLLRAAFKRNKNAHWSVDRKEQIAAAKEARQELLEKEAGKAADADGEGAAPSRREQRRQRREDRRAAKAEAAEAEAAEAEASASAEAETGAADETTPVSPKSNNGTAPAAAGADEAADVEMTV
ncbi:MAG: hypothetical protein IT198_08855 [Acidimicrobiia bacterium]|nr:hypothetical protein [Acidimicrobiia bacterium]